MSPAGVFAYGAIVGKEHYEIVERSVTLPRLSPRLNGLRLVQLTDIHVGNFMKQAKLEWYVRAVNDLPDSLVGPAWVVMQLGTLGAAPAAAGAALAARESGLARRLLVSSPSDE